MERKLPFFSIIIPTRNRPEQLVSCLHAMTGLEYPRELFEIVVVADGCQPPPDEKLLSLYSAVELTILTQDHAGPAVARNSGARRARGDYFVFTDDDCAPQPEWLLRMAESIILYPDRCIGGQTVNALPLNRYSAASQFLIDFLYAYYRAAPGGERFFASNNMAVPAVLFRAINGFSSKFHWAGGEDRDFCRRWKQKGYGLVYVPQAIVSHSHVLSFAGFIRQQFNYGRGSHVYHDAARVAGGRMKSIQPLSFYAKLAVYPVMRGRGGARISLTALFVLSQLAVAAGRMLERGKEGGNSTNDTMNCFL